MILTQRARVLLGWFRNAALPRLLPGNEGLSFLMTDNVTLNAIRVAATLGIPDLIQAGVNESGAIAEVASTNEDATSRLLRHLVARGVFAESKTRKLSLTPISTLLTTEHPLSRKAEFDVEGVGPKLELALSDMLHSIRTGKPAYERVHGKSLWEQMGESVVLTAAFDTEMEQHARSNGASLLQRLNWDGVRTVVDIGGGTGALLRELLIGLPRLRGVLVEMSDAADRARHRLSEAGLAKRCDVVEGSFFDTLPTGGDVYILSWILHDWSDEEATQILHRCRASLREGARLLIVEKLFDRKPDTALDLRMLVFFGGKERSLSDYVQLLNAADLDLIKSVDLDNGFSVLHTRMS